MGSLLQLAMYVMENQLFMSAQSVADVAKISILGGGRGTDDKCKGFCCNLSALLRHLLGKSYYHVFFRKPRL